MEIIEFGGHRYVHPTAKELRAVAACLAEENGTPSVDHAHVWQRGLIASDGKVCLRWLANETDEIGGPDTPDETGTMIARGDIIRAAGAAKEGATILLPIAPATDVLIVKAEKDIVHPDEDILGVVAYAKLGPGDLFQRVIPNQDTLSPVNGALVSAHKTDALTKVGVGFMIEWFEIHHGEVGGSFLALSPTSVGSLTLFFMTEKA